MLKEYKKILVAVDGSDNSHLAFRHAVEVAKRNKATLYILQVINDQAGSYSPFAYGEVIEKEQDAADNEMSEYTGYASNHKLTETVPLVRLGNPKTCVARSVPDQFDIDLIVIGATGRGVINRMVVGSTTTYVVQHAKCNVLVVKNPID